ncbi:MAG: hypothetical protein K8R58_06295 [Bacteroidales bacterium]|nr:hypothetical protein [Bacteroidales bacterium]
MKARKLRTSFIRLTILSLLFGLNLLNSCKKDVEDFHQEKGEYSEYVCEFSIHDDSNNLRVDYSVWKNPKTNDYLYIASTYEENNIKTGEAYVYVDDEVITKVGYQELVLPGLSTIQINELDSLEITISENLSNPDYYFGVANYLGSLDTYSFQMPKEDYKNNLLIKESSLFKSTNLGVVVGTIIVVGIGAGVCVGLCLALCPPWQKYKYIRVYFNFKKGCGCECERHNGGSGGN